ncbi:MAG: hypothetical protein IJJ28_08055, partial [Lentisphaeria bacterium]|nr:hypothetical protein [Lentisphaeria bacterium]
MGYNRQETGTLTAADGDLYIFSSATDSSYDPAPDYRDLTVSGAGQTYTELTVSDGGIVRVGTGAIWNGGAVYAGGSAVVSARGKLQNVTIASEGTISGANVNAARTATTLYSAVTVQLGGKLQVNGQWNELDNLVVNSGGRIELGAGFTNYVFAGSDTYIASGTWFKNGGAATDLAVVNGVVTGFGTIGAVIAYVSNGITIDGGNTNH